MKLRAERLYLFVGDRETPGDVDSLYSQIPQRMTNRSLEAEIKIYPKIGKIAGAANRRNGKLAKIVKRRMSFVFVDYLEIPLSKPVIWYIYCIFILLNPTYLAKTSKAIS